MNQGTKKRRPSLARIFVAGTIAFSTLFVGFILVLISFFDHNSRPNIYISLILFLGGCVLVAILVSSVRNENKRDLERMQEEMKTQFAPDTPMPTKQSHPQKRHTLTKEDYQG